MVMDPENDPMPPHAAAIPVGVPVNVPPVGTLTDPVMDPQEADCITETVNEPLAVAPVSVPPVGTETVPLISLQVAVS